MIKLIIGIFRGTLLINLHVKIDHNQLICMHFQTSLFEHSEASVSRKGQLRRKKHRRKRTLQSFYYFFNQI